MYEPDRGQFSVASVDVTILLPCLNEIQALPHCVTNAHAALRRIEAEYGFTGEILVADNGSTDGSQALAMSLGARVEPVPVRGYGAALIAGCHAARGRFILMGDADGSYDFNDGVAMIGKLAEGSALCMGSRFDGGITPGAMPWKNRHIGNPLLTGMLNLFSARASTTLIAASALSARKASSACASPAPAWNSRAKWSSRPHC
jgi:glycosyltransferase involved in cell wall biosynthesis